MNHQFRIIGAIVAGLLLAVALAAGVAEQDYILVGVLAGVMLVVIIQFLFGKGLSTDATLVALVCSGFYIAGKGFSYISPIKPIYIAEIALAFCGLWYVLGSVRRKHPLVPKTALSLPLILLLIYMVMRLAVQDAEDYGFMAFRDSCIIYYCAFFFVGYRVGSSPSATDRFVAIVLPAAIIGSVVFVLCNYIGPLSVLVNSLFAAGVPFLPANDAVNAATMGAALWAYSKSREKGAKVWFLPLFVFLLGPLATFRGSTIVALLLLTLFMLLCGEWKFLWIGAVSMIAGLFLAIVVLSVVPQQSYDVDDLLEDVAAEWRSVNFLRIFTGDLAGEDTLSDATANWRLQWWSKIVKDVSAREPVFGFGFGANIFGDFARMLSFGQLAYISDEMESTRGAHNAFFTILFRMGWLGAALFLWVLLVQLREFWFATKLWKDGSISPSLAFCWGAIVCGFAVTFFQYTWDAPYSAVAFWTLTGVAYAANDRFRALKEGTERPAVASLLPERTLVSPVVRV